MYTYMIDAGNVATVFADGKEVMKSRPFRLRVQAERCAEDYIAERMPKPEDSITLEVQSAVIDVSSLFKFL